MIFAVVTLLLCLVQVSLSQVTCPGLGDFNPEGPFDGWPDPSCPGDEGFNLTYTMFNSQDPRVGQPFSRSIVPPNFNPGVDTVFFAHGWTGNGEDLVYSGIKNVFMNNFDVNYVIVGWGGPEGAEDLNYFRSASDTRTVGAETAEVMINLVEQGGGSPQRMHFSGHSLGAQVTGHAGRWASDRNHKVARCTGLDPAGPFFINNTDRAVGIYNDCADFVDIIHTDQRYGSTPEYGATDVFLGHQDFFINGGLEQPNCTSDFCDHARVLGLWEESATNGCFDAVWQCDNSADIPDSCSPCGPCPRMGIYGQPGPVGRFYLETTGDRPFCSP